MIGIWNYRKHNNGKGDLLILDKDGKEVTDELLADFTTDEVDGDGDLTDLVSDAQELRNIFDNASDSVKDEVVDSVNNALIDIVYYVLEQAAKKGYVLKIRE